VGFLVVDELARHAPGKNIVLFKPQKFMNRSGQEVKKLTKLYPLSSNNLFVIHDDLDIPLGKFKITQKGQKVHNGLKSIYEQIGVRDFWHVRVGIDGDRRGKTGEEYVLENWRPEEKKVLSGVIKEVINALGQATTTFI
jgi:PTH1 family peptidyl-tRNA hydrolase